MIKQNTSHAVMSQRNPNMDTFDNFPTPPWATRAFVESQLLGTNNLAASTCLEPACGQGYMSETLKEYFGAVSSFDILDYGYKDMEKKDFLRSGLQDNSFDWVITNPPFKIAEDFIFESLRVARVGVAMLVRTVFIESVGRYDRLFSQNPPTYFAQYVERVAMVKGRLDRKASTATGYGWAVCTMGYPQLNNCAPRASLGIFGHKNTGQSRAILEFSIKNTPQNLLGCCFKWLRR